MLGKLLKYDLKSMLKTLALIWIAALVLALVNHFTLFSFEFSGAMAFVGQIVPALLYGAALLAMAVLTLIFIISRFYNGLLRDEGYLMFTLPVKPWQLITSKGLSAVIVLAVSLIVSLVSAMILAPWDQVSRLFCEISEAISKYDILTTGQVIIIAIELFILTVISLAKSVYLIYASISLGHLFKKHRKAMAFVMFIAINFVISIVGTLLGYALFGTNELDLLQWFRNTFTFNSTFGYCNFTILIMFLISAVQLVIFHVATERILSKRLNLE